MRPCRRIFHPPKQESGVLGSKRGIVADAAKESDGGCGFKPVAILNLNVSMEAMPIFPQMKPLACDGVDVRVYDCRTTDETHDNVSGSVVAERYGQPKEF